MLVFVERGDLCTRRKTSQRAYSANKVNPQITLSSETRAWVLSTLRMTL